MSDLDLDEPTTDEQHPAAQRIQQKQESQATRELAIVDAGLTLDKEKRAALLAVVGEDLSPENIKTKAEALGFVAPPAAQASEEEQERHQQDAAALDRMSQAAAQAASPVPPASPIDQVMAKARQITNPAELQKLMPEAMAAIAATPGLSFGPAESIGGFTAL